MSTDLTKFDILFRDIFNNSNSFNILEGKQPHPLNIFYDDNGLHFEVACTGLTKDDVEIKVEDNTLQILYDKPEEEEFHQGTIHRGLSKKSFKLAYKIAPKYDLGKIDARLDNGLLQITIGFAEEAKPKTVKIK